MKIALIDNSTDCLPELLRLCSVYNYTVEIFDLKALTSKVDFTAFNLILLSGGLWYDDEETTYAHYHDELKLIAHSGTPLIGICLGMLLTAHAFGAHPRTLTKRVYGKKPISLTPRGKEVLGDIDIQAVHENHSLGITEAPPDFEVLATSPGYVEIMSHISLPMFGVQFHPEMLHDAGNRRLWSALIAHATS